MSFLPKNTKLGILSLVEVYVYYDRPCLFSCCNETGQLFLAVWIDESSESERWLYTPISEAIFDQVRSGDISFRSVFQNAVGDRVFDIEVFNGDQSSIVNVKHCCDLLDNELPID